MTRFEDSISPFGVGSGASTSSPITCGFCGHTHNATVDIDDQDAEENIRHINFGGLQICECCFERLENAVLQHMRDILPWYARLLKARAKQLSRDTDALSLVAEILAPPS